MEIIDTFLRLIGRDAVIRKEKAKNMLSAYQKQQGSNAQKQLPARSSASKGENKTKTKVKKVASQPNPVHVAGWRQEFDADFVPYITNEVFMGLIKFSKRYSSIEIAGNFVVNENDVIVYASLAASLSSGATVDVDYNSQAQRLKKDRDLGWNPNGQWHTHPGMGAFFSRTDLEDHAGDLNICTAWSKKGVRYFMVVSGTHLKIRRYRWDENVRLYYDTNVRMQDGTELKSEGGGTTWSWGDEYVGHQGVIVSDYYNRWRGSYSNDWNDDGWEDDWNQPLDARLTDSEKYDPYQDIGYVIQQMAYDMEWYKGLDWVDYEVARQTVRESFPLVDDLCKRANHDDELETANIIISLHGVGLGKVMLTSPDKWDRMLSGDFVQESQMELLQRRAENYD